jgi:hypothetical protein
MIIFTQVRLLNYLVSFEIFEAAVEFSQLRLKVEFSDEENAHLEEPSAATIALAVEQ